MSANTAQQPPRIEGQPQVPVGKLKKVIAVCVLVFCTLWLVGVVMDLVGCGKAPIKDLDGRVLPHDGAEARLTEKHGFIAVDEQAMRELLKPHAYNVLNAPKADQINALEQAIQENARELTRTGRVFQVAPGTKLRILTYLKGDYMPINGDGVAFYVRLEILEGPAKGKVGYTVADGVE
jgi:hypothetical protein